MVLPIYIYGEPVLRVECALVTEVTQEIRDLAEAMIETMIEADGVGLAAPQIGRAIQLAVVDVAHAEDSISYFKVDGQDASLKEYMPLVFINPVLEFTKKKHTDTEGCLSMPGLRAQVTRPAGVKATLTLLDGRTIVVEGDGLLSRAIQHETDHLHGRLFIDRLSTVEKLSVKRKLPRYQEQWIEELREQHRDAEKSQQASAKS